MACLAVRITIVALVEILLRVSVLTWRALDLATLAVGGEVVEVTFLINATGCTVLNLVPVAGNAANRTGSAFEAPFEFEGFVGAGGDTASVTEEEPWGGEKLGAGCAGVDVSASSTGRLACHTFRAAIVGGCWAFRMASSPIVNEARLAGAAISNGVILIAIQTINRASLSKHHHFFNP